MKRIGRRRVGIGRRLMLLLAVLACLVAGALLIADAGADGISSQAPVGYNFSAHPLDSALLFTGRNPRPVTLRRPQSMPLSAVASLGRRLFHDPLLSASGAQSCASCHDPQHAFAPANTEAVQRGGAGGTVTGERAVPSLMYLYRQSNFSIGPDNAESEGVDIAALAQQSIGQVRAQKTTEVVAASAAAQVPQGGLFWDGRSNTLQDQALGPLFNPVEMANTDIRTVAQRLATSTYRGDLAALFGEGIFSDPNLVVAEALFAIARYQIEDPAFHPFASKFDDWLEGHAVLTPAERRGYLLFNDPAKANCAGCHLDRVSREGVPPMLTDTQYEALGVPRNDAIPVNRNPAFFDMGMCGPDRRDLAAQRQFCGFFLTPTLRNVATRGAFFHNGRYHTLNDVMRFYDFRDTDPARIYGRKPDGAANAFDDLPPELHDNIDHIDAPLDRRLGQVPAMTESEMDDIVAFMGTLTDRQSQKP